MSASRFTDLYAQMIADAESVGVLSPEESTDALRELNLRVELAEEVEVGDEPASVLLR